MKGMLWLALGAGCLLCAAVAVQESAHLEISPQDPQVVEWQKDGRAYQLTVGAPRPEPKGIVAWEWVRDAYSLPDPVLHEFLEWLVLQGEDPLDQTFSDLTRHARAWLGLSTIQWLELHEYLHARKYR